MLRFTNYVLRFTSHMRFGGAAATEAAATEAATEAARAAAASASSSKIRSLEIQIHTLQNKINSLTQDNNQSYKPTVANKKISYTEKYSSENILRKKYK